MAAMEKTKELEYSKRQEEMTMEDDASNSDEDSEDSEGDDEQENKIHDIEEKIKQNPFQYDLYVELIEILRNEGELDRLRSAREKMNAIFPLTQKLWLEWIEDEMKFSAENRTMISKLFNRAVHDYMAVGVWLEYVQYIIGDMAEEDGIKKIRQVFEQAITAVGLHVSKGGMIWDAYREFENAILMGLQPSLGSVTTALQQEQILAQTNRVASLFRRQLAVPLIDIEGTFNEYKDWCSDELDTNIEQNYITAKKKLAQLLPYENSLLESGSPHLKEYESYIEYELSRDEPARIQCIYERAIEDNCLVPQLWIQYGKYVDTKLRVGSVAVGIYERSVRNCPWCANLWLNYGRALERHNHEHDKIKGVFEQALRAGLSQGSEYLLIWTAYCDYLRRRILWEQDHIQELEELKEVFAKAITHLSENFSEDGSLSYSLLQYWARIEAKFCHKMDKARDLWNQIMQQGFGNQASSWLDYFNLERSFGDNKHCRKIMQKAVNSVSDYPEVVFEAYINFEREEGTLEQYDQAVSKCDAQLQRVQDRRAKAVEKESNQMDQKKKQRNEKKFDKKPARKVEKKSQNNYEPQTSPWETRPPASVPAPLQALEEMAGGEIPGMGQKRKRVETSPVKTDADGFKVPPPPGFKPKMARLEPPPGFKPGKNSNSHESESLAAPVYTRQSQNSSQPPPGYKAKSEPPPGYEDRQLEPSQPSVPSSTDGQSLHSTETMDTSNASTKTDLMNHSSTVFISNLNFQIKEHELKEIFSKVGEVKEVHLVKSFKGQSKGYAYIEFIDELLAHKALEWDRQEIKGRPMFVSSYKEKGAKSNPFKYAAGLEKNKLFIQGLPFTMTKEALETLFKEHGTLKSVRLVTYRSGQPKGLAYLEYENEADAGQAVMKFDQLKVGENVISVSISNPPSRKTPLTQRDSSSFTPTLGSGKRETIERGKARTQLSLVPRSLQRGPAAGQKPKPKSVDSSSAANQELNNFSSSDTQGNMTNADFRNMLLAKR